jgi:hypothetical protein
MVVARNSLGNWNVNRSTLEHALPDDWANVYLLPDYADDSLSKLEETLRARMREISGQLSALPVPLSEDPQRKLLDLCGEFAHDLSRSVDGSGLQSEYYLLMKPQFEFLKSKIEETKPWLLRDGTPIDNCDSHTFAF